MPGPELREGGPIGAGDELLRGVDDRRENLQDPITVKKFGVNLLKNQGSAALTFPKVFLHGVS